jgi:hypothetical protein
MLLFNQCRLTVDRVRTGGHMAHNNRAKILWYHRLGDKDVQIRLAHLAEPTFSSTKGTALARKNDKTCARI